MTMKKKKHKLMVMMMMRQSNSASYIDRRHTRTSSKRKSWYIVYSSLCLLARFYLKGFLWLLFEWRERERNEKKKNNLPPSIRSSINDYTRLIIIFISSSSLALHFHALSLYFFELWSLNSKYTRTLIWQWLCAWPQCEREYIHPYTSLYILWKKRERENVDE